MNARYSLGSLAAALMFIAPASQAEKPAPGVAAPACGCSARCSHGAHHSPGGDH